MEQEMYLARVFLSPIPPSVLDWAAAFPWISFCDSLVKLIETLWPYFKFFFFLEGEYNISWVLQIV